MADNSLNTLNGQVVTPKNMLTFAPAVSLDVIEKVYGAFGNDEQFVDAVIVQEGTIQQLRKK